MALGKIDDMWIIECDGCDKEESLPAWGEQYKTFQGAWAQFTLEGVA